MGFHSEWDDVATWIQKSQQILIKKLSRNDCAWADSAANGHQNGFFIPKDVATSDFFPQLANTNPEKPHIFECVYPTFWPSSGETKQSTIKHYSLRNPGVPGKERPRNEWHHTGVPKDQFRDLSPASLLVGGTLKEAVGGAIHWFMIIDSVSDEAEIIETIYSLDADFHFGLFRPHTADRIYDDKDELIRELREAVSSGELSQYVSKQQMPRPEELAVRAQECWLRDNRVASLNPYALPYPGDALMKISRDLEFLLYKRLELRQRAAQVLAILAAQTDLVTSLVRGFESLDKVFLSAAQTRKSRAGLSFEHHVNRMLDDGGIEHEAQAPVGGRRPDFILPDVAALTNKRPDALVLSLKTTLRERWKQLGLERRQGAVFLATVDDRISPAAIKEMAKNDIVLVVPESLKKSKEAVYSEATDVISFRHFFDEEVKSKRPTLLSPKVLDIQP